MDAQVYLPLYLVIIGVLCYSYSFVYLTSSGHKLQQTQYGDFWVTILSLFMVFWLGTRPISGVFVDTINYAENYDYFVFSRLDISWRTEWVWTFLMASCKQFGFSVHVFLTIVEAGYILSSLWAVKKFFPVNPMVGMLFVFSSLMFFNFGVNGIRNGLACHVTLLAIAFFFSNKYWKAVLVAFLAMGIHRSVMLPILSVIIGRYLLNDLRYAIAFWIMAIFISLFVGTELTKMFESLNIDSRVANYTGTKSMEAFSSTGFRFDFLIYSLPPIILGWYVLIKRKIEDDWYRTLCICYCICNAFWIILIRVAFSNRFAYLSWFLYPVLIAYPFLNMPIWHSQDKNIGLALTTYCSFTLLMQTLFWGF